MHLIQQYLRGALSNKELTSLIDNNQALLTIYDDHLFYLQY